MGGLSRWTVLYVLHTMLIPWLRPLTLALRSLRPSFFSIKFRKSVVSLRYDS